MPCSCICSPPSTAAHKCSFRQYQLQRFFCWIKAIACLPASCRSSIKMVTNRRTPLTLHHSSAFHKRMALQAHIHFCPLPIHQTQRCVETDGTESRMEERASLTCPPHRLGTDWFCGWSGILFVWFFVLLTWQTAHSLGLPRSFQVLQLSNLCSLYSYTEAANKRSRDHFTYVKELNKARSSKTKSTDTHRSVTYLGTAAFPFTSGPTWPLFDDLRRDQETHQWY